jgi:hypothetical protein
MRATVALPFAFILIVVGGMLLTGDQSPASQTQPIYILGGAASLSLGTISLWFVLRNWLKWKREYKAYRSE